MPTPEKDRRSFLKRLSAVLVATIGAVVGVPIVVAFLDPLRRARASVEPQPKEFARLTDLPLGDPVKMDVVSRKTDAWDRSDTRVVGAVWITHNGGGHVVAFSAVCPHLGCSVGFNAQKRVFACPCHESAFALADGQRIFGPAPRGLDPLPVSVNDGKIFITYKRFLQGVRSRQEI